MRNWERLAALTEAYGNPPTTLRIRAHSQLDGAIRQIEGWSTIHRALSVLVGTREGDQEIAGLVPASPNMTYIRELVDRFGPETDNFPPEILNGIQAQIDGISQQVPVIVHVLREMSPEPSNSALTLEFQGKLLLDDFQEAVRDVGVVVDLLKIENDVTEVWTDFGSTVFGIDVSTAVSLVLIAAAVAGADQVREYVSTFTPEVISNTFKLLDHLSLKITGSSLDRRIIEDDEVGDLIKGFAGTEVKVDLSSDVTPEQKNGLQAAIPKLAAMSNRGWKITCSTPTIANSEITNSTIILAQNVTLALPSPPSNVEEEE